MARSQHRTQQSLPGELVAASTSLQTLLSGHALEPGEPYEPFGLYAALMQELNLVCLVADSGREASAVRAAWDAIKHEHAALAIALEGVNPVRVVGLPDTPFGDTFNAEVFAECYRDTLRFCEELGGWYVWQGTHWQADKTGQSMEFARTSMRALGEYAARQEHTALMKHVSKVFMDGPLNSLLKQARSLPSMVAIPSQFDQDPWLLNCINGTLDLRTGRLRRHEPDDWITKCLTVPYDETAQAPIWTAFLWKVMGGEGPDDEGTEEGLLERHERAERLCLFLQRTVGYALTGITNEDCLFILYGSGRNGKSKFLDAIKSLLSGYAKTAQMSTFLHQDRETVRNDLADLKGVRLVSAIETGEGSRFSEGLVKQLTGGDAVKARFLYEEYFEFLPNFKLFLAFNHRPEIRGTDTAIWERVKMVPFDVFIPLPERDRYLADKLHAELPGILAWAVEGCLSWQQDGLKEPPEVVAATADYREEMDRLGAFIRDCCVVSPDVRVAAGKLYAAYQAWHQSEGGESMKATAFGRQLTERGFAVHRGTAGKKWRKGIGLPNTEAEDQKSQEKP